jgi:hypothetical protein
MHYIVGKKETVSDVAHLLQNNIRPSILSTRLEDGEQTVVCIDP